MLASCSKGSSSCLFWHCICVPEFRYAKEFLMLKMCYCSIMLNTGHAHPFTIILGVKNQSEAMAASRYPFSGEHAECKKLSWYMWYCFCFRAFVLVVGTSKYCFMAQQVSTCHFSLFIPLESVVVGNSSAVMDWQRKTDERKCRFSQGWKAGFGALISVQVFLV